MTILQTLLHQVPLRASQRRFLSTLMTVWLAIPGRINAATFARYSGWNEKTLRNWFRQTWPWNALHTALIQQLLDQRLLGQTFILGIDATFLPKAGTVTPGVGSFWNGSAGRAERGLELSCCTLIDVPHRQAFPLDIRQTRPKTETADRLLQYQQHLDDTLEALPGGLKTKIRAVVADGQYAKTLFMQTVTRHGLPLVTKLQGNANLRYRFEGVHPKRRGPKQKFDGKVDFEDWQRWTIVSADERERVLTCVLYAPHFERDLRVVVVQRLNHWGQVKAYAVLCSTDTTMTAEEVRALYSARFEMEFVFRDAKQYAGLKTCQMRDTKALEAHWNVAFLIVSLVRAETLRAAEGARDIVFQMENAKRRAYNVLYARRILFDLGLEARFEELASLPSRPLDFGLQAA